MVGNVSGRENRYMVRSVLLPRQGAEAIQITIQIPSDALVLGVDNGMLWLALPVGEGDVPLPPHLNDRPDLTWTEEIEEAGF